MYVLQHAKLLINEYVCIMLTMAAVKLKHRDHDTLMPAFFNINKNDG